MMPRCTQEGRDLRTRRSVAEVVALFGWWMHGDRQYQVLSVDQPGGEVDQVGGNGLACLASLGKVESPAHIMKSCVIQDIM